MIFAGCEEKQAGGDDPDVTPTLSVTPASIPAEAEAGNYTITVASNTAWTAAVEDAAAHNWCTITNGTKGSEDGTITLRTVQNTITEERYALITVTTGTLTRQVAITQAAAAPVLNVDKTDINATATAAAYTIGVTSNLTWTATVSSGATWCTLPNSTGGLETRSNNGTVTVNVAENPTAETRAATVTVTSGTLTKTVAVTQAAAVPTLEVDKTTIEAGTNAAAYTIGVTSNATWMATVNSGATWCTLANANATGNGMVTVNVAENPTVETRTATVTVTSGTLTKTVAVTQATAGLVLNVDKTTINAAVGAAAYTIGVTSNATWTATVSSGATWCTLTNNSSTGNGTVTVNVVAHNATTTRTATVTLTSGTLTKTVAVTQAAAGLVLNVDKTMIEAGTNAANYPINVTSNATWTATVSSSATWCTLTGAAGNGNGVLTVNVAAQPMAATRAATVTFTAGTLTRTLTVAQAGAPPTLTTDETAISAAYAAGNYPVSVTGNAAWIASVNSAAAAWCTVSPTSGTGDGTASVNVATNPMATARAATVTFTAGTLTRTLTVAQAGAPPTLTTDKPAIDATSGAGNYAIAVTGNTAWTAAVNDGVSWCAVSPNAGTGNGALTVIVAENTATAARAATVTLTSGTITRTVAVTQAGAAPTLSIYPTTTTAPANGGNYTVEVTGNALWTVTVDVAAVAWCTASPTSGTGSGAVSVSIAANSIAAPRAATLTFTAGTLVRQFTVTQAGAAPALAVSPETVAAANSAGIYTVTVTGNSTWTATVNAGDTWCAASPASGTGDGAVLLNITENTMAIPRATLLTLTAGTLNRTVPVTQTGAQAALTIDETEVSAGYAAGSYPIAVTSNANWTATVNAGATWCTASPASGTGNGTVGITVAGYTAAAPRAATVTFAAGSISRTVNVTQVIQAHAASTQTWTFGNQTWSDAIQIVECNKTSFTNSDTEPHCRSYNGSEKFFYYYNWPFVNTYKDVMCPEPWRMPSLSDFSALLSNTAYSTLPHEWGYGGQATSGSLDYVSTTAYLWSVTRGECYYNDCAQALNYGSTSGTTGNYSMYRGFQVRCIK
jgi:hypothetical protein